MKIIDEREMQKQNKTTKKDRKKQGGTEDVVKGWELSFVVILQLICEASLIFKSDLELPVSISK